MYHHCNVNISLENIAWIILTLVVYIFHEERFISFETQNSTLVQLSLHMHKIVFHVCKKMTEVVVNCVKDSNPDFSVVQTKGKF